MKILVLGHGGHGKGAFCRLLETIYGLKPMSSSMAALPHIWPSLQAARGAESQRHFHGPRPYKNPTDAYNQRRQNRELWKALISLYNTPDKSTLARALLAEADIYDGMRDVEEFAASRHLFDLIYWVDASERCGPDSTMEIERESSMIYINNNGPECNLGPIVAGLKL